jgi:hypothetical protein
MESNKIEDLLDLYLKGETTLKEEAQLKTFFTRTEVPAHLKSYKPLFNYFNTSKTETFTKPLPLQPKHTQTYKWLSVAAAVVISAGVYFNWTTTQNDLGTFEKDETQLAYNQFITSMELVSKNFNKGTSQVSYLHAIQKANEQVSYLNEFKNPIGRIIKINNNN